MTREALLWSNQLRHRQNCDVTNDFLNIKIHGSNLDVTKYLLKFTLNKSHLAAEHSTGKFRFISVQNCYQVLRYLSQRKWCCVTSKIIQAHKNTSVKLATRYCFISKVTKNRLQWIRCHSYSWQENGANCQWTMACKP